MNKKKNIEKSLRYLFIKMFTLTMLLSIGIATFLYVSSIIDTAKDSIMASVEYNVEELNDILKEGEEFLDIVQADITTQAAIREGDFQNKSEEYAQKTTMNAYIRVLTLNYSDYIDGAYVVLHDGRAFKSSVYPYKSEDFTHQDWYREILDNDGITYGFYNVDSRVVDNVSYEYFTLGKPLYNYRTGQVVGITLLEYKLDKIKEILGSKREIVNLAMVLQDGVSHERLVISDGMEQSGLPSLLWRLTELTISQKLVNGWEILCSGSWFELIRRELAAAVFIICAGGVIIVSVSVLIALNFSKSIITPINSLLEHMKYIDEQWLKDQIEIPTEFEEIDGLVYGFNKMHRKINQLFEKEKETEANMQQARFMALQAQINPHFLYNSLEHIAWMIRLDQHQESLDSLMSLSRFFRLSLDVGADMITLEKEVEHVRLYLQIQDLRYQDQISSCIESRLSQEALEDVTVPKFIIQPLVENAIYHGIRDSDEHGDIRVTLWEEKQYIFIEVWDNGLGIEASLLKKLQKLLDKGELNDREDDGGYGIFNVNQRIKYLFGEEYGLWLDSEHGSYTISRIKMPLYPKNK